MRFITDIEKDRYEEFVKNHKKSHFLQSYAWGEFAKKEKHLEPHYVGLEDNGKLVATALILEKKLPLHLSYFYIPRGYVLDYDNFELLSEFTKKMKEYAKKHKAIFIKIDPDNVYHEEDTFGNVIQDNNDELIKRLKSLGYKHMGFTKNFETMQPRYTFRIHMDKSYDELVANFSKTTKQRIKKANDFNAKVRIGNENDIHDFYNLMLLTENRKDFVAHDEQYYRSLYEIWNKDNSCNIFLGSVDLDEIISVLNTRKKELTEELETIPSGDLSKSQKSKKAELERQLEHVNSDIDKYVENKDKYGSNIILSAHFILEYGDMAWELYAGNHNAISETYANYKTYDEHIKYYYDKGIKIYDQFGTVGDLRSDNPLLGLHEFKKKFGGNYVEFCGEFDLITNKLMYFVFKKLVPFYRNIMMNSFKKKNLKQENR